MTRDIQKDYFNWLCKIVSDSKPNRRSYSKLLWYLHEIEFTFIIPMDENRCVDGVELRYRYGRLHNIEGPVIASCLDVTPCSVLEMMVALAARCEDNIMVDPAYGSRPGRWFWMMIRSLGLGNMSDGNFDIEYANSIIWRFLNREFERDGKGGLVYIPGTQYDMRSMEIWYQMQRYLIEYRRNGE